MERRTSVSWHISMDMELKYLSYIIILAPSYAQKQISERGTSVLPLVAYLISRVDWQPYTKWYCTKIDPKGNYNKRWDETTGKATDDRKLS
jgi:hypothetical protein